MTSLMFWNDSELCQIYLASDDDVATFSAFLRKNAR